MLNMFWDILFPQTSCCLCRKAGWFHTWHPWCDACDEEMRILQDSAPICDRCGKYLLTSDTLCWDCRNNPPAFMITRAVGPYEETYRIAIKVLKFLRRTQLAVRMGYMMAEVVRSEPRFSAADIILPVPSSWYSLEQRGFNQTDLLAYRLSKQLKIKTEEKTLVRVKDTPLQRECTKEEREKNLLSAFAVNNPEKIKDHNVLLVDDVYTTGSTIRECSRTLLEAGATQVMAVTWAIGRGT